MPMTDRIDRTTTIIAALAILVTVATQIAYLTIKGEVVTGPMIWGVEVIAFLAVTLFALVLAVRSPAPLGWAALVLFGLFNTVQAGMGLTMFGPLTDAGEAMAPAMQAVVAGAFLFFFAAKVMMGVAALTFGAALVSGVSGVGKAVGGLAMLTGLASLAANIVAIFGGMEFVQPAGAAGTAAALFAAIALLIVPQT